MHCFLIKPLRTLLVDLFVCRLLQEALETASARPGTYGAAAATPSPINTVQAPAAPAAARSASSSAAAGVVSMLAAAAAAALML